jgi:hypothetical protein
MSLLKTKGAGDGDAEGLGEGSGACAQRGAARRAGSSKRARFINLDSHTPSSKVHLDTGAASLFSYALSWLTTEAIPWI